MNSYKNLVLLFIFVSCSPITETNWSFLPPVLNTWESVQTYGGSHEDIANAIIVTQDGGFAVIGNTKSTDGNFSMKTRTGSDLFLMKFSAEKKLEWIQTYGGSDDDRGHGLVQLSDEGFALIGYSKSSDGDASINKGQHDNWVLRTDKKGIVLWEKSFGYLGHDHAYNIIATSDGGLFFNGFLDVTASNGLGQDKKEAHFSSRHGVGEFWVHKIDLDGNIQWRRYFGGTSNDRSYDAIQSTDGGYVIVGSSESQDVDITRSRGSYDIWIIKINDNGNLLWECSIGGSEYDKGNAIVETMTGEYLVLGQTYSSDGDILDQSGSSDILMARLSKLGIIEEVKTLGDSGFETAKSIIERPDGTFVLVGQKSSSSVNYGEQAISNDVSLYYTLPNGNLIKSSKLSGAGLDEANDLVMTQEGKIIVVGSSESSSGDFKNSNGDKDVFIAFWH